MTAAQIELLEAAREFCEPVVRSWDEFERSFERLRAAISAVDVENRR